MRTTLRFFVVVPVVFVSSIAIAACFDSSTTNGGGIDASTSDVAQQHDTSVADAAADAALDTATPDTSVADAADACPSYSPIGADGGPPAQEEDAGTLPGPLATQCSATGTPPATTINWANNSCDVIEAWWVDFGCQELYYNDVPAMGMFAQPTFVGHRWRLRAKGTHLLLKEVDPNVDANPRTVTFP